MRITQTVELDGQRSVMVRELRVADVRNAIANKEKLEGLDFASLLSGDASLFGLLGFFGDCIELPKKTVIDDLCFSEIEAIWAKFREVNAPFFRLLGWVSPALATLFPAPANSTAPAASSSNGDTQE